MRKNSGEHEPHGRNAHADAQRDAHTLSANNEKLRVWIASLGSEKRRLQEQLTMLRKDLARHQEKQADLQVRLAQVETESRQLSARCAQMEQENSSLANLYVASYRLHETVERQDVLHAIQEIVANLIGSEEIAIYELNRERSALVLAGSFGIEPERLRTVPLGAGLIGATALSGETCILDQARTEGRLPQEANLTACVPLKLDGRVTGAITLFRLLPQKAGFQPVDRQLFDLLATHAATALYCSDLQARLQADTSASV